MSSELCKGARAQEQEGVGLGVSEVPPWLNHLLTVLLWGSHRILAGLSFFI